MADPVATIEKTSPSVLLPSLSRGLLDQYLLLNSCRSLLSQHPDQALDRFLLRCQIRCLHLLLHHCSADFPFHDLSRFRDQLHVLSRHLDLSPQV